MKISLNEFKQLEVRAVFLARGASVKFNVEQVRCVEDEEFYRNEFVVNGRYINSEYNKKDEIGFVSIDGTRLNG